MWRATFAFSKKGSLQGLNNIRHASSNIREGRSRKVMLSIGGLVASAVGFSGLIVYGKYDPNLKRVLEDNLPYVKQIYQWLPTENEEIKIPHANKKTIKKEKEDLPLSTNLKKKIDKDQDIQISTEKEGPKLLSEPKVSSRGSMQSKDDKSIANSNVLKTEPETIEQFLESTAKMEEFASQENAVLQTIQKLKKSSDTAVKAQNTAVNAIKYHTEKLYEAVDLSEGNDGDLVWKEAKTATIEKEKAIKNAKEKSSETKMLIQKLKEEVKTLNERDPSNPLVKNGNKSIEEFQAELNTAESGVTAAETEAKSAAEYEHLVNASKEQFRRELKIVLPNYIPSNTDKSISEDELNLLIAHAHRRIEKLQKEIAKQKISEKLKVDQAVRTLRIQDEEDVESRVHDELKKRHVDLESAVANRVSSLKANLEAELHQQLLRQAAAHADHLKEVLKVQEQELDRKHILELEEKLLHQKGIFISEISGNMARIKGILEFLKAKSEFDKSSKKAQALWLTCQALNDKITQSTESGNHSSPLAKDIASIKIAAEEDNEFINGVLQTIPADVIQRGVFTSDALKNRFEKVKSICQKVALIDENNDSLFRYVLSYLQSILIVNVTQCISKEELEGKIAVDPSKWDTFDILRRISYCLAENDLEQALRYANQLKGEPKAVAKDWVSEVKLHLETQLAVKALLAHAAAVSVQAYH